MKTMMISAWVLLLGVFFPAQAFALDITHLHKDNAQLYARSVVGKRLFIIQGNNFTCVIGGQGHYASCSGILPGGKGNLVKISDGTLNDYSYVHDGFSTGIPLVSHPSARRMHTGHYIQVKNVVCGHTAQYFECAVEKKNQVSHVFTRFVIGKHGTRILTGQ